MDDSLENHIFFSDPLSDDPMKNQKRREFYTSMIRDIIARSRFVYKPEYYRASIDAVEEDMMNLNYGIDLYPAVNARIYVYHNIIVLNLFSFVAANRMTIMDGLLDLLSRKQTVSYEEVISQANQWAEMYDHIHMIDEYIRCVSGQAPYPENGTLYMEWPKGVFQLHKYSGYAYCILQLILLHELGHWQYARFNEQKRQEFFSFAYSAMLERYPEAFFTGDRPRAYAWAEEITADYIALMVYTLNNREKFTDKQCTRECYVAIGLFYGLIALDDLAHGRYKNENAMRTHPPAFVRQDIVMELYFKFLKSYFGMSWEDFFGKEILEWRVIQDYFAHIIEEYWRRKHG